MNEYRVSAHMSSTRIKREKRQRLRRVQGHKYRCQPARSGSRQLPPISSLSTFHSGHCSSSSRTFSLSPIFLVQFPTVPCSLPTSFAPLSHLLHAFWGGGASHLQQDGRLAPSSQIADRCTRARARLQTDRRPPLERERAQPRARLPAYTHSSGGVCVTQISKETEETRKLGES
eukprot:6201915-Pleurochrysis_carterae.AAC.2